MKKVQGDQVVTQHIFSKIFQDTIGNIRKCFFVVKLHITSCIIAALLVFRILMVKNTIKYVQGSHVITQAAFSKILTMDTI